MKYGNRSIRRKIVSSPFTALILLVIFFVLIKATWGIYNKSKLSDTKLKNAQAELIKLEARKQALSGQVNYLMTEQGVEAELRTKYRAVKDGESVAVILDDSASTTITLPTSTEVTNSGWWGRMLRVVGL